MAEASWRQSHCHCLFTVPTHLFERDSSAQRVRVLEQKEITGSPWDRIMSFKSFSFLQCHFMQSPSQILYLQLQQGWAPSTLPDLLLAWAPFALWVLYHMPDTRVLPGLYPPSPKPLHSSLPSRCWLDMHALLPKPYNPQREPSDVTDPVPPTSPVLTLQREGRRGQRAGEHAPQ